MPRREWLAIPLVLWHFRANETVPEGRRTSHVSVPLISQANRACKVPEIGSYTCPFPLVFVLRFLKLHKVVLFLVNLVIQCTYIFNFFLFICFELHITLSKTK